MLKTIQGRSISGNTGCDRALSIVWLLVLYEFINGVVIPIFIDESGLGWSKRFRTVRDQLTANMLEDCQYRDYLRDAVFMYAAADAMTLVSTLRPGRFDEWCACRNAWCWTQLCFHQSLWDFKLAVEQRKVNGRLQAKMMRTIGDLASEKAQPPSAAHQASRQFGPPPSWLTDNAERDVVLEPVE